MKNILAATLLAGGVLGLAVSSANAATVLLQTQAVNASDSANVPSNANINTLADPLNTVFSLTSGPVQSLTHGGGIGFGTASVDITTGQLKAQVTGTADTGGNTAGIAATGFVEVKETYKVVGSGTVSALLDVSGNWNLDPSISSWQIQAKAQVLGGSSGSGLGQIQLNQSNSANSGSINNQTLQGQRNVANGDTVTFVYSLLVQAGDLPFDMNFMNTANAFYVLDGVELVAIDGLTDSRFLSDPAFNTPIPIPAAAWFFLSALGGLGFAGWRKRRTAAV